MKESDKIRGNHHYTLEKFKKYKGVQIYKATNINNGCVKYVQPDPVLENIRLFTATFNKKVLDATKVQGARRYDAHWEDIRTVHGEKIAIHGYSPFGKILKSLKPKEKTRYQVETMDTITGYWGKGIRFLFPQKITDLESNIEYVYDYRVKRLIQNK